MSWQRYLIDSHGFVLEPAEELLLVYAAQGEDAIQSEYGDMVPDRIVVVRDSALPKPQYEGSEVLRAPGSYATADQISFDVSYVEEADYALTLWRAAEGIVLHLNADPQEDPGEPNP